MHNRNMKDNYATKIIPIQFYTPLLCNTKVLNVSRGFSKTKVLYDQMCKMFLTLSVKRNLYSYLGATLT